MRKKNEDQFQVLRKIKKNPESTQRELAKDLGLALESSTTVYNL